MAEAVVGVLTDKLVSVLEEEVRLLKDVEKKVREMASELKSVLSVLKDADKKAETEGDAIKDGVKSWVQELREVAFEIEDGLTEYTHHMTQQQHSDHQGCCVKCLLQSSCFSPCSSSSLNDRRAWARKIQKMNTRLYRILKQGERYKYIKSIQQESTDAQNVFISYDPRGASRYLHEDDLVGVESAKQKLVDDLLDMSSERIIIPVVGMGGLGKTTLAQQVYKHMQGSFQCHAWVQVPQQYNKAEILRTLITEFYESTKESVPGEIDTMEEGKLTSKLREYLQGKKYLVIFDDVWKEDFWGDIDHVLVSDKVGGRIMITTRKMQVAKFCEKFSYVHIHEMERLPVDKAWELFRKRTFGSEGCCPKELGTISGEIVERCEGLPLAIVVIAGLLSTKKTIKEWQRFYASLSSELENNFQLSPITKILSLSYNDLPYYLKSCLLYFGMFPRRHSIRHGRLIRQWIAEGFVKVVRDKTPEEVAQEYMNELMDRSLVQALDLDVNGKTKKCRVHDLLHEIILKKTGEISFCSVSSRITESKFKGIIRRLSIMNNISSDDLRCNNFHHAHSAFVFCEDETLNSIVPVFATNFKFLKVLDFEDAPHIDHLPKDIGNLFDLRYLSVRGSKVSTLPRSIEKLEKLETLDLKWSLIREIPTDMINKLGKLRHLFGCYRRAIAVFGYVGMKVVGGIGGLKALQKLYYIEADGKGVYGLFKELENLTRLRTLGIIKLRREDGTLLCGCVEKMSLLESLTVSSVSENEEIDLESMSSPPELLGRLTLRGRLRKLPEWFTQLQSLVKIKLSHSMLEDNLLEVLQKMQNLLYLDIRFDAYVGAKLHFKKGAFSKLKKLYLYHLNKLQSLTIEESALPMLEELYIGPCPQMKVVPSGLEYLKNLKILLFFRMPVKFMMFQDFGTLEKLPVLVVFNYINDNKQTELVTLQDFLLWRPEWLSQKLQKQKEGASSFASTIDEQEKEGASTSGTTTTTREFQDATERTITLATTTGQEDQD
ncbi:hypothetical protein TIFTF001_028182 [Ficus carica]|uniref:Uncharacterized protein n=1 Tax=Ficus carica TaxID=3494 RepID=A0AA88DPL6_FICCA|nr:hypothetical protein TIFTF001_028182 [Ficus carica]